MSQDADKRAKMEPRELTFFEMYIELKSELTSRIFALELRVRELEDRNLTRTDMRIGGKP